jgi:hypothetical protein
VQRSDWPSGACRDDRGSVRRVVRPAPCGTCACQPGGVETARPRSRLVAGQSRKPAEGSWARRLWTPAHGGARQGHASPVVVTDIEARLGTRYTGETIEALIALPGCRFVWLMGADNLAQFHLWQRWDWIMRTVPICVLARPGHRISARTAKAAQVFRHARLSRRRPHMACLMRRRLHGFFSTCRWSMYRRPRSGRGGIGSALAARSRSLSTAAYRGLRHGP